MKHRLMIPPVTAFKEPYLLYLYDECVGKIEYEVQLMWLRCEIKKYGLKGYAIIKEEDVVDGEINYNQYYRIDTNGLFIHNPPGYTFHEKFLNQLVGW